MDGRGDHGESVAIIGIACRFPGARDPAEFHDLAVAGRGMFQPAAALRGRPLRAAVLNDWNVPQIPADDFLTGALSPPDLGPVRKLAAEMTALALTDAGLRDVAGTCRTGLIIASSVPGLGDQVREEFGFAARGPFPRTALVSSLHAVVAAGALQTGELDPGPPRRRLVSTITGHLVTAEDDIARLLAGQVIRPVLVAQAMAEATAGADLIVTAGPDAGLGARATECTGVAAVPIPAALPSGHGLPPGNKDQSERLGATLTQAIAALFTAGALTDLTPFLAAAGEGGKRGGLAVSVGTLASRPVADCVPRMRSAQEAGPSGPAPAAGAMSGAGAGNPARSVP